MNQGENQNRRPTCGVIVPVYNRGKLVLDALQTIAEQTVAPDVLVIVDDGSTDDSADQIQKWINEGDFSFTTKLIRQANQGAAHARNTAANELRDCDFLAFLDSDDLWPPQYLEKMIPALAAAPDAVAVCSDRKLLNVRTGREKYREYSLIQKNPIHQFIVGNVPTPSLTVMRSRVFFESNGFNESMEISPFEDVHLHLRLCKLGEWISIQGVPVTMRRGLLGDSTGEANLTHAYHQPLLQSKLLGIFEDFLYQNGGCEVVRGSRWRKSLAKRWRWVGDKYARRGRHSKAGECYRRAISIRRLEWRSWIQLAKCRSKVDQPIAVEDRSGYDKSLTDA